MDGETLFWWHRRCIFSGQPTDWDKAVGEPWKILVADRNRNVRDLLRRELLAEGYSVEVAKDGHDLWLRLNSNAPPDLVILDLEIPFLEDLMTQGQVRNGEPPVPVIIYSYLPEEDDRRVPKAAAFLEKKEDTQRLKEMVAEVLRRYYPSGPTAGSAPA